MTVLVIEPGDLHEDDAALRLAAAVGGPGLEQRGPNESRVDLVAAHAGSSTSGPRGGAARPDRPARGVHRPRRLDRRGGAAGRVGEGRARTSCRRRVVDRGVAIAGGGRRPLVRVAPFVPMRVGVVVKESLRAADRERFERSVRDKVESLGSAIVRFVYCADESGAVESGAARR